MSMSLIFQVLLSYAVADGGVPVTLARTGEMGATCANVINAYSASSVTPDAVVPAPPLFDARWTLRVVESVPAHACTAVAAPPAGGNDFALIALRGNCTFSQKMAIARAAGARALVVANTLATMYSAPSNGSATATPWPPLAVPKLTNPCSVDCALARGVATNVNTSIVARGWDCSGFSGCASKICAATGAGTIGAGYEYCCLLDVPALGTIASASAATDPIVLFVGVGDGAALISDARAQRSRIIFLAGSNVSKINPSSYMIWLLGVFTVVCAAWRAAGVERRAMLLRSSYKRVDGKPSRRRVRGVGDDTDDAEEEEDAGEEEEGAEEAGVESVSITIYHAFAMIVMSAVLLLVLFFFITAGYLFVVTIVVIVFCIGSWQAMTEVYFAPPLRLIPWIRTRGVDTICGDFTLASLIAAPISLAIVVAWFAFRNTWSLAWVVQDAMSFALACTFLETIRFNSIKIATVLLSLFFVYDIIMVFITPFIFSSSVMLTVATGGGPRATLSGGTCIHTQGETLPLLYKVPRIGGCTPGQYAMLGLGDIVVPGLLLTFALRFDYTDAAKPLHRGRCPLMPRRLSSALSALNRGRGGSRRCAPTAYFALLSVGYAVGLCCAFLANAFGLTIAGVRGQPALLYLVPCTLLPLVIAAVCRGDLCTMWRGDHLLSNAERAQAAAVPQQQSELQERTAEREEEV